MEKNEQTIFRKKTLERISSPEQLTTYLSVTNPGIWVILAAVIFLLAGIFSWSAVGILETKVPAKVTVVDQTATVITLGSEKLEKEMPLRVGTENTVILSISKDEYGRSIGKAVISLPDGSYDGTVVVEQTRPIDFLLESR